MPRKNPALRYPVIHQRDHARPRTVPAPTTEEFDAQVTLLVYPVALGLWDRLRGQGYRERVLTLPVMVGILLSLVWRQMPSLSELKRVLGHEPLLWVAPTTVSQQAISQRLETLPAHVFAELWAQVTPQLQERARQRPAAHAPILAELDPGYARVWVLDSSRLEAVFKKSKAARLQDGRQLGGTLTTVLDLGSHLPVHAWVDPSPTVNDRLILPNVRERTPPAPYWCWIVAITALPNSRPSASRAAPWWGAGRPIGGLRWCRPSPVRRGGSTRSCASVPIAPVPVAIRCAALAATTTANGIGGSPPSSMPSAYQPTR